jgi:hypothetical protein
MHSPKKVKLPCTFGNNLNKNTLSGTKFSSYIALISTKNFKIAFGSSDVKHSTSFNKSDSTDPSALSLKPCGDSEKVCIPFITTASPKTYTVRVHLTLQTRRNIGSQTFP